MSQKGVKVILILVTIGSCHPGQNPESRGVSFQEGSTDSLVTDTLPAMTSNNIASQTKGKPGIYFYMVAISNFKKYHKNLYWPTIHAYNDSAWVSELANRMHASFECISDKKATKKGIMAFHQSILEKTPAGSTVYIIYSTHGVQVCDENSGRGDEDDGLDEAMVTYTSYPECPKKQSATDSLITDDELGEFLDTLRVQLGRQPGGKLILLCDACYSGTMYMGPTDSLPVYSRGKNTDFRCADCKSENNSGSLIDAVKQDANRAPLAPMIAFSSSGASQSTPETVVRKGLIKKYYGPLIASFCYNMEQSSFSSYDQLFTLMNQQLICWKSPALIQLHTEGLHVVPDVLVNNMPEYRFIASPLRVYFDQGVDTVSLPGLENETDRQMAELLVTKKGGYYEISDRKHTLGYLDKQALADSLAAICLRNRLRNSSMGSETIFRCAPNGKYSRNFTTYHKQNKVKFSVTNISGDSLQIRIMTFGDSRLYDYPEILFKSTLEGNASFEKSFDFKNTNKLLKIVALPAGWNGHEEKIPGATLQTMEYYLQFE